VHPTRQFSPGTALSHKYLTAAKKSMQRTWIELQPQIFYTSMQTITPTCKNMYSLIPSVYSSLKLSTSCLNMSFLLLLKHFLFETKEKELFSNRFIFLSLLDLKKSARLNYVRQQAFLWNAILCTYTYLCCLAYSVVLSEANKELAVGIYVGKRGILMSNITCTRSKLNRTEHTWTEYLNERKGRN
jgi:hypothetical protein